MTNLAASSTDFVACHECDLLHSMVPVPPGARARCSRCKATLVKGRRNSADQVLALTLSAFILFVLANTLPFLQFDLGNQSEVATIVGAVIQLIDQGMPGLALLVFLSSALIPLLKILSLFYVALLVRIRRQSWRLRLSWRWLRILHPWGMLEVYLFGCIIAFVKLADLATVQAGLGFYSFAALLLVTTWAGESFDERMIWETQ